MNKNLNCNQVSALINFYIEGKLSPRLCEYIERHLDKCPHCKEKIRKLREILNKYRTASKIPQQVANVDYSMIHKLSAYVDNELDNNENIKVKKMTISNPQARQELETLYKFKKAIHSAYERTKNNTKFDCTRDVMAKLQYGNEYSTTYFYKLAIIFAMLLIVIIAGFIYLYF